MQNVLEDQRAIVTGSGSGLGRSIACKLASVGAEVAIIDVNEIGAQETCRLIEEAGGSSFHITASVAEADAVTRAFSEIDEKWSDGFDILVNNAGINMNVPTFELDPKDWRRALSVNLDGTFYCSREAGLRMRERGKGSIVSIGSLYAIVAAPERAAYCASKAGIAMLTKSLAIEWASIGIRVNAVCPGYALTPAIEELAEAGRIDIDTLTKRIPQGRLVTPEEIADAVLYFCEERSSHVTGQVFAVDGGWTAYGYV